MTEVDVARDRDGLGRQLVVVAEGFCYHWDDRADPLGLGDRVLLPATPTRSAAWESTVVALAADYGGYTKGVLDRIARGTPADGLRAQRAAERARRMREEQWSDADYLNS